ncbi:MAG: ATP-binding protein [Oligoflexus sp.]
MKDYGHRNFSPWDLLAVSDVNEQIFKIFRSVILVRVLILSSLFTFLTPSYAEEYQSSSKSAEIDLHSWDSSSVIKLDGPWDFYWQEFLEPDRQWRPPDLQMPIISKWNGIRMRSGEVLGGKGYATYRLSLIGLKPRDDGYLFSLTGLGSAAKMYVMAKNDLQTLVSSQVGQVDAIEPQPSKRSIFLQFSPKKISDVEVIVQVANQDLAWGGIWQAPSFGPQRKVMQSHITDALANAASMGIAMAVGFYSFFMFLRRRPDKASLILAIYCVALILRSFCTTSLIANFLPQQYYFILQKVAFSSVSAIMIFAFQFLRAALFPTAYRLLWRIISSTGTILIILPFITPSYLYTSWRWIFHCHVGFTCCAGLWILIQALIEKREGANLISIGFGIAIMGSAYDTIIVAILQLSSYYIGPISVSLFLLIQSQLVAKRAADAYRRAEHYAVELVKKDKARTIFFHNTSHELRTPLNGIIGFLDLLKRERYGETTEAMQTQLSKVEKLAITLKNQVNLILDLAKASHNELDMQNTNIDLNEFVSELEGLAVGLQLKHKNSSFHIKTSWEKNSTSPQFVFDREKLLSIARNLLGNAFKFSHPQTLNRVECRLNILTHCLIFEVQDQGIGIPDEEKESIFTEFKQVQEDARRNYEGTGLGLALVKRIVDLVDGGIELESKLGEGSSFRIHLPEQTLSLQTSEEKLIVIKNETTWEEFDISDKSSPGQTKGDLQDQALKNMADKTILVVDDNEMNCEVIHDILSEFNYKIEISIGGRACLDYLQHHRPDLILLDLMMPEVSGEDVLREIKACSRLREIPVILVTARASMEDRILGLKMGADDYLAKPIVAPELILRVQNMLERIELTKLSEHIENREKMALMGELLGELSHEIKNVNSSVLGDQKDSLKDLDLLWSSLGLPANADLQLICRPTFQTDLQSRLEHIIIPPDMIDHRKQLEILKIILASSALSLPQIDQVWAEILSLPPRQLLITQAMIGLSASVIRMSESSKRTYDIISIILRYGKEAEPDSICNLREGIEEVLQLIALKIRRCGIELIIDIPDMINVRISRVELGQIILNLLHNAIDAYSEAPNKSQQKRIHLSTQLGKDQFIHLLCRNHASTITEDAQAKIFERGFSTKESSGSGLGLYISKKIAQRVHGDLRLLPTDGDTCFDLKLEKAG